MKDISPSWPAAHEEGQVDVLREGSINSSKGAAVKASAADTPAMFSEADFSTTKRQFAGRLALWGATAAEPLPTELWQAAKVARPGTPGVLAEEPEEAEKKPEKAHEGKTPVPPEELAPTYDPEEVAARLANGFPRLLEEAFLKDEAARKRSLTSMPLTTFGDKECGKVFVSIRVGPDRRTSEKWCPTGGAERKGKSQDI
ncbi:hypothetical protein ACSSS7_000509 [Eimeria intestinalis]